MRVRSAIAFTLFLGCGASDAGPHSSTPVQERDGRTRDTGDVVLVDPPPSTVPPPVLLPQGTLDERIAAHEKAMRDTQFQDVGIIVELARLQLLRDNRVADVEGSDDVARGKKNAMRAVAVDDKSPAARLALALAIVQTFRGAKGGDDASLRATRLRLVELVTAAIPKGEPMTDSVAKVLAGYLALERGDRAAAKSAFEAATKSDAKLAAAWAGLADTLRSQKDYAHALDAYKQAAFLLASDPGIEEGMRAAEKGVVLKLPDIGRSSAPSDPGTPLASPVDTVVSCGSARRSGQNDQFCLGLDALARANRPKQLEDAAAQVLSGFREMTALCEQRDAACGDFVSSGLYAAARGFRRAGLMAKSIAASRLLLANPTLPGAKQLTNSTLLELGDQYFAIGVFDTAADFYERYAREQGPSPEKARDRAAFIRAAFRQPGGAPSQADGMACPSPLTCGARYLLAEPRWTARQ